MEIKGQPLRPVWVSTLPKSPPPDNVDLVLCYPKLCLVDSVEQSVATHKQSSMALHSRLDLASMTKMGTVFSGYDHHGKRVMGAIPSQVEY